MKLMLIIALATLATVAGAASTNCPATVTGWGKPINPNCKKTLSRSTASDASSKNSSRENENMFIKRMSDSLIVAATICAEAGGEPYAGKMMVGEVIANRSIRSGFTPRQICLQPRQFSCWNNKGTMELKMQTMRKHPAWNECVVIAGKISQPGYVPASPATHYYAPAKASPSWASKLTQIKKIGNHIFGRIS